ncbi:hypothetical protein RRG08_020600 [Elysia crispata]|uniref:Uncharacterized protein n=1 Tax=Elysia crispata TaxID=231223 RepID=A0AAE1A6K3_9GAST|nr:hypothetical protein RRG08_020600 [Elysia crispata]
MGEARLVKRHNDSFVKPTDELAGRGKAGGGLFLEQGSTMSAGTVQRGMELENGDNRTYRSQIASFTHAMDKVEKPEFGKVRSNVEHN